MRGHLNWILQRLVRYEFCYKLCNARQIVQLSVREQAWSQCAAHKLGNSRLIERHDKQGATVAVKLSEYVLKGGDVNS